MQQQVFVGKPGHGLSQGGSRNAQLGAQRAFHQAIPGAQVTLQNPLAQGISDLISDRNRDNFHEE